MSLYEEYLEPCFRINKTDVPDGYGGMTDTWVPSEDGFAAAFVLDTSTEARKAQAEGVTNLYTITVSKSVSLEYDDIIQRVSDESYFRVTSSGRDKRTPASASLDMRQVSAEMLEGLPD